jgi:hypothetical protein
MAGTGMDESYSPISVDVKRVTDNHQDTKKTYTLFYGLCFFFGVFVPSW